CLPVTFTVKSGFGTSSSTYNSRNDGTATAARISTGTMVHMISIGVLCVVRDGFGFARALNRTITTASRTSTKTAIALVSQYGNVLKPVMSSITGEAESCSPICHGDGWPSPAKAAPALASKIPKISALAHNRDKTGIALGSPRLRPFSAAPTPRGRHMHTRYMFTMQRHHLMAAGRRGVLAPPTRHRRASVGRGLAIRRVCFHFRFGTQNGPRLSDLLAVWQSPTVRGTQTPRLLPVSCRRGNGFCNRSAVGRRISWNIWPVM